jgi:hypothetical protein
MPRGSEDVLDNKPIHLDQYAETMLDFLGLSHPSPEDELIAFQNIKEILMSKKKLNTMIHEVSDIEEASRLAGIEENSLNVDNETVEEDHDGNLPYGPVEMVLPGTMMTILIHDVAMKLDAFGLPRLLQSQARSTLYNVESNKLRIEEMVERAKERRDPTTNAMNRIMVESEGDTEEEVDYELTGLTTKQRILMAELEDQNERHEYLLTDLDMWYDAIAPDPIKYPLLNQTRLEVRNGIIRRRLEEEKASVEEKEKKQFRAQQQMARIARAARLSTVRT